MLYPFQTLKGFRIHALDGEIGTVQDCLFDDEKWVLRYLVVETGGWFSGKDVVISPLSVKRVRWTEHFVDVALTREHVEKSPELDPERLHREQEAAYFNYFRWPYYWTGTGIWGIAPEPAGLQPRHPIGRGAVPPSIQSSVPSEITSTSSTGESDLNSPHLHSIEDLQGCVIEGTDGAFGEVTDFVLDPRSWKIRYLAVESRLPGLATATLRRAMLVAPEWVDTTNWRQHQILVHATREQLRHAPPFDPKFPVSSEYEADLERFYEEQRKSSEPAQDLGSIPRRRGKLAI